jgi:hypothetical protein
MRLAWLSASALVLLVACDCGGGDGTLPDGGPRADAADRTDGGDAGGSTDAGVPLGSDFPAQVQVDLESFAAPGGMMPISWTAEGAIDGLELSIGLRAPGSPGPTWSDLQTGVAPPTGAIRWLDATGAWVDTEAALPPTAGTATTPVLDAAGEWRLVATLREPVTREIRALEARRFVVTAEPAIRLQLNRRLASTLDSLEADLDLYPGTTPRDVRIVAYLDDPDGVPYAIPWSDAARGLGIVYEGPAERATFSLLGGPLPYGEGFYNLHVRVLDVATGEALGLAYAHLGVCDSPTMFTARATSDVPLAEGRVTAWDVTESGSAQEAAIEPATGEVVLALAAGVWVLVLEGVDTDGTALRAAAAMEIRGGCADATDGDSFELEPVPGAAATTSLRPPPPVWTRTLPPDLASDRLPPVRVLASVIGEGGVSPDEAEVILDGVIANVMPRWRPSTDIAVLAPSAVSAILDLHSFTQMLGVSTAAQGQELLALGDQAANPDFIFLVHIEDSDSGRTLSARIVDHRHLRPEAVILSTERMIGPRGTFPSAADIAAVVTALEMSDGIGPSRTWLQWFRSKQFRPLKPQFLVTAAPDHVPVGEVVTFSAALHDIDMSPVAARAIDIELRAPSSPRAMPFGTCTTGTDGRCSLPYTAPDTPSRISGSIRGFYQRPNGIRVPSVDAANVFYITTQRGLRLRWLNPLMHSGDENLVRATVTRDGMPIAGTGVALTATGGTIMPAMATTGSDGEGTVRFTAGPDPGPVRVTGRATILGEEVTMELNGVITPRFGLELIASPTSVMRTEQSRIIGRVRSGTSGVGGATVRLRHDSTGTLPASVVTDPGGDFVVVYTAPPMGSGFARITATVQIPDQPGPENTVVVEYVDPEMMRPMFAGMWTGTYTDTFHCDRFECGGMAGCVPMPGAPVDTMFTVTDTGGGAIRVEWQSPLSSSLSIYEGTTTSGTTFSALLVRYRDMMGVERPAGLRDESFGGTAGEGVMPMLQFHARAPCHTYDFMVPSPP